MRTKWHDGLMVMALVGISWQGTMCWGMRCRDSQSPALCCIWKEAIWHFQRALSLLLHSTHLAETLHCWKRLIIVPHHTNMGRSSTNITWLNKRRGVLCPSTLGPSSYLASWNCRRNSRLEMQCSKIERLDELYSSIFLTRLLTHSFDRPHGSFYKQCSSFLLFSPAPL